MSSALPTPSLPHAPAEQPAEDARRPRSSLGAWEALGLYTSIVLVLAHGLLPHLGDHIFGFTYTDNFYNAWYFWWFKQAIESGQNPAHTHLIYGLLPSVQVFVEFWVADTLGFLLQQVTGLLSAYNLVILLSFVLSALFMYLLAGEFVGSWLARFSAGFLYSFSTYHFYRATAHIGLASIEWLAFFAWRVVVFYRRPTALNAALAGLGLALAALSDIYYLAYFAMPFLVLFVVWRLIDDRQWFMQGRHIVLAVLGGAVAIALATPLLAGYVLLDPDIRHALPVANADAVRYSADLLAFFLPGPSNPFLGHQTLSIYSAMRSDQMVEEAVFLGYPALLLSGIALLSRRNRTHGALFWLVVGVCGLVLALGPEPQVAGHTLISLPFYRFLFEWGPLTTLRAPNRLGVLTLTAVSILSAYAIGDVLEHLRTNWAKGVFGCVVVGLLGVSLALAAVFSVEFPSMPAQAPPIYSRIARDPSDGLVLELPIVPFAPWYSYYQTVHRHPLVNGYVSRFTQRMIASTWTVPYLRYLDPIDGVPHGGAMAQGKLPPDPRFRAALRKRHILYVLLNNWVFTPKEYAHVRAFLRGSLGPPWYTDPVTGQITWRIG